MVRGQDEDHDYSKVSIQVRLAQYCPNIRPSNYTKTSEYTDTYNCVGWAIGLTGWFQPYPKRYKWIGARPTHLDDRVETYIGLFKSVGFTLCEDPSVEQGFEKIAIYDKDGAFRHVAKQLPCGSWSSKVGEMEDILHAQLEPLEFPSKYGRVKFYMKRPTNHRAIE